MVITYTAPRSTPWTTVIERLVGELSGMYNFGSPRLMTNPDDSITVTIEAVRYEH